MKVHYQNTLEQTGMPDGTLMEFDAEGAAHLMSILSNQYADGPLAVLREYVSNAIDSHTEAGQTRPVEVRLPTNLNPTLTITDFGVGMSLDTIIGVYSRYGKSTKRDTNTLVGAFGIGAKAAFTVASQFTVIGHQNGWRTTVVFALDAQNRPTYRIVDHTQDGHPNGVTVHIAVDQPDEYERAARTLFEHFDPTMVVCPGVPIGGGKTNKIQVADHVWVVDHLYRHTGGPFHIIMGHVAYEVPEPILRQTVDNKRATIFGLPGSLFEVPIGTVDLTPSREALRDSPRTIEALRNLYQKLVNEQIPTWATRQVAQATTFTEAVFAAAQAHRISGCLGADIPTPVWRGHTIDPTDDWNVDWCSKQTKRGYSIARNLVAPTRTLVVTDSDPRTITGPRWGVLNSLGINMVVFANNNTTIDGIDVTPNTSPFARHHTWRELVALTKTTPQPARPRREPRYWVAGETSGELTVAEIQQLQRPLVILPSGNYPQEIFARETLGWTTITLHGNQSLQAAHKRIPTAHPVSILADEAARIVSERGWEMLVTAPGRYSWSRRGWIKVITGVGDRIDDPQARKLAETILVRDRMSDEDVDLLDVLKQVMGGTKLADPVAEILERYPLLAGVSHADEHQNRDHMAAYMNAIYALEKEQS